MEPTCGQHPRNPAANYGDLLYTPYVKRRSPIRTTSHPNPSPSRSTSEQNSSTSSRNGSPLRTLSASHPDLRTLEPLVQSRSLKKNGSDSVSPFRPASPLPRKIAAERPDSFRPTMEPVRHTTSMPMEYRAENTLKKIPYRPGFQPKGVMHHRTDEFMERRAKHVDMMDLDDQRMERRLGKLMAIYSPDFELPEASGSSHLWQLGGERVWDIFSTKHEQQLHRLQRSRRLAEQRVVKWQEDGEHPRCCICQTSFSLAVRRHHCRSCGRLVCSSPCLPQVLQHDENIHAKHLEWWEPCSSLMFCDALNQKLCDFPKRPDIHATPAELRDYEAAEMYGIRFCRSCKIIVHRIMLRNRKPNDMPLCSLYQVCILRLTFKATASCPKRHQ